jgi:hypothetical protein
MAFSTYDCHIPRCQHIKTNGIQCGSPALRRRRFCFFHNRWRATRLSLNQPAAVSDTIELPVLEDAGSIQMALMQVMRLILARQLDHKTGGLLLYGLQTASANLRHLDLAPPHKPDIVIDLSSVSEVGVGDDAWDPEDFEEEEGCEEEEASANEDEDVARALLPATPSISTKFDSDQVSREEQEKELHRLQAAMQGAKQGNWRDLKTVFEFAGIYPPKDDAASGTG